MHTIEHTIQFEKSLSTANERYNFNKRLLYEKDTFRNNFKCNNAFW